MSSFLSLYILFNQIECLIWGSFGLFFLIQLFRQRHPRALVFTHLFLVIGFLFFGLSDYVEASESNGLPWWLWFWKISLGVILFALLVWRDYLLHDKLVLKPWHFTAAGVILALALYQAL